MRFLKVYNGVLSFHCEFILAEINYSCMEKFRCNFGRGYFESVKIELSARSLLHSKACKLWFAYCKIDVVFWIIVHIIRDN